jgi:hypothetical protein
MGEERKLVHRVQLDHGAGDGGVGIAFLLGNDTRAVGRIRVALDDLRLIHPRVRAEIPVDIERIKALPRRPEMLADDRDPILDP